MKLLQLYIEGERIDLFKDESVTITDSIQNVKDIEKVFTSFSQSFSIPASKTNNKIFKHYYNFDIINGFDARKKVSAKIEINYQTFKTGKIKLEGVDLKDNKPHTYRITFFGDIVSLKDKIGERKLSSLNNLASLNQTYNSQNVVTKLTGNVTNATDITCPLITHTQRLYYDTTSQIQDSGNLHWNNSSNYHGVKWNELKFAIRCNKLIEAIEDQYNLEFSTDFFKNENVEEMNKLFMWLHRKSGAVEDLSGGTQNTEIVDGWTFDDSNFNFVMYNSGLEIRGDAQYFEYVDLQVRPNNLTDVYSIEIAVYGENVYTATNIQGNLDVDCLPFLEEYPFAYFEVYITTTGVTQFNTFQWLVNYQEPNELPEGDNFNTGSWSTSGDFIFNINRQLPDMKILDFLTGLFKMFNLTAYVENDIIVVKRLDAFYEDGKGYAYNDTPWDITEYVDKTKSAVNLALPYKEVIFKFNDTGYFLAQKFSELNNRNWGELYYNQNTTDYNGGVYKIELPFGHMLYERLTNAANQNQRRIQWGWSVNDSQNAYLGKPLLFYPLWINSGGISFVNSLNTDGEANGKVQLTNVVMPFNVVSQVPATNNFQLNFNLEVNEWTLDTEYVYTLFEGYYKNFITSTFNLKQRITKVTAYLPQSILMNYTLADVFVISGNRYRINSITTNVLTGKSEIELLNELRDDI